MRDALYKVKRILELQRFRSKLENALKSDLNSWVATCNRIKKQKVRLKVTLSPPDSEVESVASMVMTTLQNTLMWMRKTIFMGLLQIAPLAH